MRRIFGPNRNVVTGGWRKIYNYELNDLYCSPNNVRVIKSRRMRLAEYVARMSEREREREKRTITGFWCGNLEGKSPLKRPRRRWEDNIEMDIQEVGWDRDWIDLAQDRDR